MSSSPALFDRDGDQIPDWLDKDSDNDSIPDAVEGTDDLDGDDLPNYVDTDSDGNLILDSVERGSSPGNYVDTDKDSIPDWRDLDDDGDLVLDVNDPDRLLPVAGFAAGTANSPYLIKAGILDSNGNFVAGVGRAGDALVM